MIRTLALPLLLVAVSAVSVLDLQGERPAYLNPALPLDQRNDGLLDLIAGWQGA